MGTVTAIALSLLVVAAGFFLLLHSRKEDTGKVFSVTSYVLIVAGILLVVCSFCCGVFRMVSCVTGGGCGKSGVSCCSPRQQGCCGKACSGTDFASCGADACSKAGGCYAQKGCRKKASCSKSAAAFDFDWDDISADTLGAGEKKIIRKIVRTDDNGNEKVRVEVR